ncbi:hypothetical protein Tco_0731001 [Tanacetum coccineum]
MFLNVDQLEKQLDKEEFQDIESMAAFKVLETQFQKFIKLRISLNDEDESGKRDISSRLGNDVDSDDADIKPIYDEELIAEIQLTAKCNVFATGQQHTEQLKFNNEGGITKLSNQSLEFENTYLKKTVAQFQIDFSKLEAHCINLELQLQNNVLKSGQQGQFLKEKSNEGKVKHDIDVIETIRIELEHKVAKLLKENETLKKHYKELSDSIKTTRAKTIEHTTYLIAQNAEFNA